MSLSIVVGTLRLEILSSLIDLSLVLVVELLSLMLSAAQKIISLM